MATLIPASEVVPSSTLSVDGVMDQIRSMAARIHDDIPLVAQVAQDKTVWMWDDAQDGSLLVNPRAVAKLREQGVLFEGSPPKGHVIHMLSNEWGEVQDRLAPKMAWPKLPLQPDFPDGPEWPEGDWRTDPWLLEAHLRSITAKYKGLTNTEAVRWQMRDEIYHALHEFLHTAPSPKSGLFFDPPYYPMDGVYLLQPQNQDPQAREKTKAVLDDLKEFTKSLENRNPAMLRSFWDLYGPMPGHKAFPYLAKPTFAKDIDVIVSTSPSNESNVTVEFKVLKNRGNQGGESGT